VLLAGRELVRAARLAPFPEWQAVPGADRVDGGAADAGEHEPGYVMLAGLPAICSAGMCPPVPFTKPAMAAATLGCSPQAALSARNSRRSSLRSSLTSHAASHPAGAAPEPP
jgi:hypothetical protein